jgi:hypothetical protein
MPKRVIDFEAMWASDKLSRCAEWAQAEYAWLYGLADANGSFELTNLRVIWGRVAAIRKNLSLERLEQIFGEFSDKGLLFTWEENGKKYGHWTHSDLPGRLPPQSWRNRLERLAPPVPAAALEKYSQGLRNGKSNSNIKAGLEVTPGQDLELERDLEKKSAASTPSHAKTACAGDPAPAQAAAPSRFAYQGLHLEVTERQDAVLAEAFPWVDRQAEYRKMNSWLDANPARGPRSASRFAHNWFSKIETPAEAEHRQRFVSHQALPEARVGLGPSGHVKPEYLEKIRLREQARRASANQGSSAGPQTGDMAPEKPRL